MLSVIGKLLLNVLMAIISDKVVVEVGKKLITKGVDSTIRGVGISDEDAQYLVKEITRSAINSFAIYGTKREVSNLNR